MNIGARIGHGHTAEVYALDSQRVAKRFKNGILREVAEREASNTRAAIDAGLPVPEVYELTSVEGNPAIVYERVCGDTMFAQLRPRPWTLRRNARRLAQLHREIHATTPSGLRSVHDRLTQNIQSAPGINADARKHVLSRVDALPQGHAFCHGDFHPQNVLLADEPVIIDWLDAGEGHPATDVARTSLLLRFAGQTQSRTLSTLRTMFRRLYLRFYCAESHLSRARVRAWELPVAVARLTEDVPEEARLRSFIESRLPDE